MFQDFKNLKKKLEILLSREKYSREKSIDSFVRLFLFLKKEKKIYLVYETSRNFVLSDGEILVKKKGKECIDIKSLKMFEVRILFIIGKVMGNFSRIIAKIGKTKGKRYFFSEI